MPDKFNVTIELKYLEINLQKKPGEENKPSFLSIVVKRGKQQRIETK
jgi:hypothetical protein